MDHHTRRLYAEFLRRVARAETLRWATLDANPLRTGAPADVAGLSRFGDLMRAWDSAVEDCRIAAERYAFAARAAGRR